MVRCYRFLKRVAIVVVTVKRVKNPGAEFRGKKLSESSLNRHVQLESAKFRVLVVANF